jgi:hypothetical protein
MESMPAEAWRLHPRLYDYAEEAELGFARLPAIRLTNGFLRSSATFLASGITFQEHSSVVLICGGCVKDLPGVVLPRLRGVLDTQGSCRLTISRAGRSTARSGRSKDKHMAPSSSPREAKFSLTPRSRDLILLEVREPRDVRGQEIDRRVDVYNALDTE